MGATPAVAATYEGGFVVVWSQMTPSSVSSNSWDVVSRGFSPAGAALSAPVVVNTYRVGDQFAPQVAANGTNCFVVWTSMGQTGGFEDVFGQYMTLTGVKIGSETRVNTTIAGKQYQPAIGVDATGRYLVSWSSYVGGSASFDLYAQRYSSSAAVLPRSRCLGRRLAAE